MKPVQPASRAAAPAAAPPVINRPSAKPTDPAATVVPPQPVDLGISERRQMIRPLPAPLSVESNTDSDWAAFQGPNSDH